jgi:putative membrane protein
MILTLPINILTLGLFTFVVNSAVLKICAYFLTGFEINGWWPAILGAIVVSLLSSALHFFLV